MTMIDHAYVQVLAKARAAKNGGADAWHVQSTGEKVTVALILNRPDWLAEMGYTISEAIDRAGSWVKYIPLVARALNDESADS